MKKKHRASNTVKAGRRLRRRERAATARAAARVNKIQLTRKKRARQVRKEAAKALAREQNMTDTVILPTADQAGRA